MQFSLQDLREFAPYLLHGTWVTVSITCISMASALLFGLFLGLGRSSHAKLFYIPATIFIDFIRGTPLLLQIFYIYYVLPLYGIELPAFQSGIVGLSLNYSAYLAEVYRSGIQAIPSGQREAALSLGMSNTLIMRRVILPQAIRIVIPPLGNYFISLFKDSALVSVIAITELLRSGELLAATTYKHFEIFTIVALIYMAISYPASWLVALAERRLRIGVEAATEGWSSLSQWLDWFGIRHRPMPSPRLPIASQLGPINNPDSQLILHKSVPPAHEVKHTGKSAPIIIQMEQVTRQFGKFIALDHVDLSVNQGEVVVILGPSGSGKSTLLRTINHLETVDSGRIWIKGIELGCRIVNGREVHENAKSIQAVRAEVGIVFQQFNLFPHRTVLENITEAPMWVRGLSPREARDRAFTLLRKVGLIEKANSYPGKLSGGQQQRVAIARALAMQPEIMLFDEVTSALDPELTGEVLRVMRDLAAEGMTMLVVTHEIGFAREVADRILFMADGQIVEQAHPKDFFRSPKSERGQAFIASVLQERY